VGTELLTKRNVEPNPISRDIAMPPRPIEQDVAYASPGHLKGLPSSAGLSAARAQVMALVSTTLPSISGALAAASARSVASLSSVDARLA
jgi:hypothetical protein